MNNKSITFDILDNTAIGTEFYSIGLQGNVCHLTRKRPFVATCLRYLRLWNSSQMEKQAVCIHKGKSLYRMIGAKP